MKKSWLLLGLGVIALLGWIVFLSQSSSVDSSEFKSIGLDSGVTVYKTNSCGCCGGYVQYLQSKGIKTQVNAVSNTDLDSFRQGKGVPAALLSCHTTMVGNYFVEGHVPLEAIVKLMKEKPDIAGIALPGMPVGSPGMPGTKNGQFVIFSVNRDGTYAEFMRI